MKHRGLAEESSALAIVSVRPADECIFELQTGRSRTYGELLALKAALLAAPVWSGVSSVRLCSEQRFYFLAALLASAERGLPVQLAPRGQQRAASTLASLRITDQAGDARPTEHTRAAANATGNEVELAIAPLAERILTSEPSSSPESIDLSRLQLEFWTSGSSEEPRAFPKNSRQLLSEARMLSEFWGVGRNERLLCTAPPHHIYGFLWGVLLPLLSGASIVSATARQGQSILEAVQESQPSRIISVPAQLAAFLSVLELQPSRPLPSAIRIVSSGAPLNRDIASGLELRGASVLEVLGSTETGGIAWRRTSQDETFQPLPHVTVTSTEAGVLLVDSAHLPDGDRPFVTTDLIETRGEGFVHLGRADAIVKIGANRVSLSEVEERALRLPGVLACRAIAQSAEHSLTHSLELCMVAVAPGYSAPLLRAALLDSLPPELWPKRIRRVDALPIDERGKVTTAALAALFEQPVVAHVPLTVRLDENEGTPGGARATLVVRVPGNASCLEGHFPADPLVPGATLLQEAILGPFLQIWPDLEPPITFENVRFERPLRPFDQATVTLERKDRRVDFRVAAKAQTVARGACSSKGSKPT